MAMWPAGEPTFVPSMITRTRLVLAGSLSRPNVAQLLAALLAEGPQRFTDRVVVHQLSQFGKRLVRREICVDAESNDRLGLFDHRSTRHDAHAAYQRIDADERRSLRLVMYQGVSVQL